MSEFRKGDRVKVEFDAIYSEAYGTRGEVYVVRDSGFTNQVPLGALTLIEPKWQPGDVVLDEDGCAHQMSTDGNTWIQRMTRKPPRGRLTRLVPEATDG